MKVVEISEGLVFDDGTQLYSNHMSDCCEHHYLDFEHISLSDFEGLEFDLSNDNFFERVPDYGIRLIPTNGHPISIPGYGYNNGYYSDNLDLVISSPGKSDKTYEITECQVIEG
jgi:hypothetical protein